MACGQKKQNTNEGGVHLTERTCSPYNPIIKQIVDDCLGLPIYPVTSIDAVIDEDGNTLRKLLEDLLDQIHTGGSITEQIEHILQTIEDLDETYVTKTELTQKLELLYKISSMNRTNVDGVQNYDTTETTKPYIVKIIEDIQSDLAGIISGGDGITLQSLQEQITALNNLLIAVANYDTGRHTDDGLTHSQNNTIPQIEIIYRIQDLITRLGAVERAIGTGSSIDTRLEEIERALAGLLDGASTVLGITDALDGRVDTLEDKVEDLEVASATHAHLDDVLLGQRVAKLEADEYPVTSAIFMGTREAFIEFANKLEDNNIRRIFVYYPYHSLIGIPTTEIEQQFDYNNNGLLDVGDVDILVRHIRDGNVITDSHKNPNVDGDDEISIGDVNALVDKIFDSIDSAEKSPGTWSKCIFEVVKPQNNNFSSPESNSVYEGELATLLPGYTIIKHPLIEGKLYVDSYSLKTFVYKEKTAYGVMSAVSGLDLLPGNGIIIDDEEDSETDGILLKAKTISAKIPTIAKEGSGIKVEHAETTNTYTVNKFPNTNLCVYGLDEDADLGTLCIGTLQAKVYRYNITPLGSGRYTVGKGDISIITEAVDALLGKTSGNTDTYAATQWFNALKSDLYDVVNTFKESTEYDTTAVDNSGDPDIQHKYDYTSTLNTIEDYLDNLFKKEAANSEELVPKTFQESLETAAMHNNAHLSDWYFGQVMLGGSSSLRSKFYTVKERECDTECDPWYADVQNNDLPNTVVIDSEITPRNDAQYRQFIVAILDANGDGVFDINDITLFIQTLLHGTWENIPPVVTVDYDQSLNIRSQETGNINGFIPIENTRIGGQMFYDRTNKEWWTSDGESFIKALPEYRLQVKDGSSWISLEKDGIIIQSVQSNHISQASESEPENP